MKKLKLVIALAVVMFGSITGLYSQGVTTSSIKGKVVDTKGEPVFSATVVATHTPTGTLYGTITTENGRFDIRNMKVGGPYQLKVTFIGYQDAIKEDIYLQLNKTAELNMTIAESAVELGEVVVQYDRDDVIGSDRTGAVTNVNRDKIISLPTISRGQGDLTRLTPESDGNSFGGRNNLYNNFSLDGSIFNNSFGLDYATPGGQADAQPVSLDAIDQIQVSLAPFDVREGGFTGAGVNAVTKSGTNEFKGSVYYFFRNENMIGEKVGDVKIENLKFNTDQYGVSVGGPIIKNKLFFFVNAERENRDQLAHGFVAGNISNAGKPNTTSVSENDIKLVQNHLRNTWGYEPGAYQGYNHETFNDKLLVKFNYNINKDHKLSVRYNMLDAWKDILPHPEAIGGRGPTSFRLPFENSSYRIFNKIHSVVGELNSMFSNKFSNKLLVGFTAFRDKRDPKSAPFPVVDILDADGQIAITMGSEMFSTNNRLYQDVFQLSDNLTYYMDKHTFTAGFNFERFKFENSFNLFYYPWVTAFSVTGFLNDEFAYFVGNGNGDLNHDVTSQQNPFQWTYVDVGQLAFYVQDEYQVNDDFKLTFGLRTDIPLYFYDVPKTDATDEAANFTGWVDEKGNSTTIDTRQWPSSKPLFSPRFGFNYDVKGDRTVQLRGGSGIFTGRIPFVWLGNQTSNSGINPVSTFQVNATADDFHFPQVWKNNIATDVKFGDGWLATVELMYSKDINAVVHRNYNMRPPTGNLTGTGDTRAIFQGSEANIYEASPNPISGLDAGMLVLDNTKKGNQFTFTTKLAKKWDFGLSADVAYTYMNSKDLTSIPAEIAADAFQRNPVVGNPNDPDFSWSRYGLQHRMVSSAMYKKEYAGGKMASSFAMFFEAGKGNRYSYVYAGDLNQDAISNNDLLYVPASSGDINFGTVTDGVGSTVADAATQWAALDAFIEQDDYLKDRRGEYAERNGAMLPWFTRTDIRFMQDFNFDVKGKKNTIQLSVDILNFGNMLNSNWGERKFVTTPTPISVTGVDATTKTPYFSFNTNLKDSYVDDVSVNSKWQMQIGIRYIFN